MSTKVKKAKGKEADLESVPTMTCRGCKQLILPNESGSCKFKKNQFGFFHPECVKCENCTKVMEKFYEENGRMLCKNCTSIMPSMPKMLCAFCKKEIVTPKSGISEYQTNKFGSFHPDCVRCYKCKESLTRFYDVKGQMLCPKCALPTCKGCGGPAERTISCKAGIFHPECYCCEICGTKLDDNYAALGVTLCQACADIKKKNKIKT
eukprot:Platyproteum_vivax@DN2451_c0_g1_i1.p1